MEEFYIKNLPLLVPQRNRLRLSKWAQMIIDADMMNFSIPPEKQNDFLNIILLHFYKEAAVSKEFRRENIRTGYYEQLKGLSDTVLTKEQMDAVVSELTENELSHSYTLPEFYNKEQEREFIHLQNDVVELINKDLSSHHKIFENISVSTYLNSVIEEYTRKPYYERERIFFKEKFSTVQTAIDSDRTLRIRKREKEYHVIPYKIIMPDSTQYNYIVGKSALLDENKQPGVYKYACFRFTFTDSIEPEKIIKNTPPFSREDKKKIEEEIRQKGVQFLSFDIQSPIRVSFTDRGLKMYQKTYHMRPQYSTRDGNILTFLCTEEQMLRYLFKFGSDAVVLEPPSLRQKFQNRYRDAWKAYEKE